MLRDLINETAEACAGDPAADLAALPRDSDAIVIGRRTKTLDALAEFDRLERLSLVAVDQETFDQAMATTDPRYLVIWDLKAADLSALAGPRRVERLVISGANKVTDIAPVAGLGRLWLLSLETMVKARDLAPLAALTALEHLCFAGGHYGSPKRVASLRPLAALTALQSVNLIGVTAADKSLEPLVGLTALMDISLSNCWPAAEFARLSVVFPDAGCEWFAPYVEDSYRGGGITGLAKQSTVFVTGARKPMFMNPTPEDWDKIKRHAKAFEDLQAEFRAQYGK